MFAMYGPEVGRRHDLTLLQQSGWEDKLTQMLVVHGNLYYIYRDRSFMLHPYLQVSCHRIMANPAKHAFNTAMSAIRSAVEWDYKTLKQQ